MEFEKKIKKSTLNEMWKKSDDAIRRVVNLSDIYDDVPPELDVFVDVLEFHMFPKGMKRKVKKYLNRP